MKQSLSTSDQKYFSSKCPRKKQQNSCKSICSAHGSDNKWMQTSQTCVIL